MTPRKSHPEKGQWERRTISIYPQHVVFLDKLKMAIYERTKANMDRSAVIRAALDALAQSKLDLSECKTEEALTAMIAERLGHAPAAKKLRK